jgi:hypothetical protein
MSRLHCSLEDADRRRAEAAAGCLSAVPIATAADLPQRAVVSMDGGGPIDAALSGGIRAAAVTEVAGEAGAGKTQFALQFCLRAMLPPAAGGLATSVVYVCTEGPFRADRLLAMHAAAPSGSPIAAIDFPLSSMQVAPLAADAPGLADLLATLVLPAVAQPHGARAVVIDSVAAPFRAVSDLRARAAMLRAVGCACRAIAAAGAAVLVLNQAKAVIHAEPAGLPAFAAAARAQPVFSASVLRAVGHFEQAEPYVPRRLPSRPANALISADAAQDVALSSGHPVAPALGPIWSEMSHVRIVLTKPSPGVGADSSGSPLRMLFLGACAFGPSGASAFRITEAGLVGIE